MTTNNADSKDTADKRYSRDILPGDAGGRESDRVRGDGNCDHAFSGQCGSTGGAGNFTEAEVL